MDFAVKLQEVTGKGYLSYSALKYAADGSSDQDMKLFELYMKGLLRKNSPALSFGKLYDCLLLEPQKAPDLFYVLDDSDIVEELKKDYKNPKASKVYKERTAHALEEAEKSGKTVVSKDDMSMAKNMILRLDASEVLDAETGEIKMVRDYLKGDAQHEILSWIGEVPVRGFLDVLGDGFITDSKSTRSIAGFKYDVNKFNYDIQAYIYTQAMGCDTFYWVVQQKSKPYLCAVYKASDSTLANGERKFWSAIENINGWLSNPAKDTSSFALFNVI
jgi:hypothetical protein|tara:strand:- start:2499 stop:3320 length:822 start_codon:yes stop_codon:yes gene_type:complete